MKKYTFYNRKIHLNSLLDLIKIIVLNTKYK